MSGNIQVNISKRAKKILRNYRDEKDFRSLDKALDDFLIRYGKRYNGGN